MPIAFVGSYHRFEGSRAISVGFQLQGVYRRNMLGRPSAEDWLRQAADVWRELEPDLVGLSIGRAGATPTLSLQAHPAVEPLELTVPAAGRIVVSANTSTGGPGYHRRMCDDLHILGDRLGVTWQPANDDVLDETGYFETGDRSAVDDEMLLWIGTLLRNVPIGEGQHVAIAMPIGYRGGGSDDAIVTALGPHDMDWVARGAADPSSVAEFFPWWSDALDGRHYLNRALAAMWVDLRWARPIHDGDRQRLVAVDRDLTRAQQLDPGLDLPWREWVEIRGLLATSSDGAMTTLDRTIREGAGAVDPTTRLIGYRRGSMPVTVGGWTIQLPGSFVESPEEKSWIGYDADRSVHLSPMVISSKDGQVPSAEELADIGPVGSTVLPGDPDLRGAASFVDSDKGGKQGRVLRGTVTAPGHVLIITIVYGDDEGWARETYR